jgi:hypothetical protein
MDVETAAPIITDLVKALRARLETIASVAKAGHACAEAGSPYRAIEIVIELGDDLHEATGNALPVLRLTVIDRRNRQGLHRRTAYSGGDIGGSHRPQCPRMARRLQQDSSVHWKRSAGRDQADARSDLLNLIECRGSHAPVTWRLYPARLPRSPTIGATCQRPPHHQNAESRRARRDGSKCRMNSSLHENLRSRHAAKPRKYRENMG